MQIYVLSPLKYLACKDLSDMPNTPVATSYDSTIKVQSNIESGPWTYRELTSDIYLDRLKFVVHRHVKSLWHEVEYPFISESALYMNLSAPQ